MYEVDRDAEELVAGRMSRQQFITRGLLAGVGVTTLGSVLAACGGKSTTTTGTGAAPAGKPPARPTGTLTVGDVQPPRSGNWDAAGSFGGSDVRIGSLIYEPLVSLDGDKVIPWLAESYERVDDRTVVFKIRQGVKWHDGSSLTAKDVVASLRRLGVEGSPVPQAPSLTTFKVKAIDASTVELVTDRPFGPLENALTAVRIMKADVIKNDPKFKKDPIGTGPFKFKSRNARETVLTAHEAYWRPGVPHVATVRYTIIEDPSALLDALTTGRIDMIVEAGPAQIARFQKNSKFFIPPREGYAPALFAYIYTQKGPMKDVKVRQALTCAVDREAIAKSVLRGVDPVPYSPFPTTTPGYKAQADRFGYDPERAKRLLAEAGHSDLKLRMPTSTVFPFAPEADQAVAKYFQDVGVKVDLTRMDPGAYASAYPEYDVSLNAFINTVPNDADQPLWLYRPPLNKLAFNADDAKMTKLVEATRYTTGDGRAAAIDAAQSYIWEQQWMLYLADNYFPEIVSTRVKNYKSSLIFGLTGLGDAWVS